MENSKWIEVKEQNPIGYYLVIDDENVGVESDLSRIKIGLFAQDGICWVAGKHFNATHVQKLPSPIVK